MNYLEASPKAISAMRERLPFIIDLFCAQKTFISGGVGRR
jgi:hypothetical protein